MEFSNAWILELQLKIGSIAAKPINLAVVFRGI